VAIAALLGGGALLGHLGADHWARAAAYEIEVAGFEDHSETDELTRYRLHAGAQFGVGVLGILGGGAWARRRLLAWSSSARSL
jgi:hypothetical protein